MKETDLIRITSNYFCVGVILDSIHLVCIDCAPIVSYMKEKKFKWILNYCEKKRWKLEYFIDGEWKVFK